MFVLFPVPWWDKCWDTWQSRCLPFARGSGGVYFLYVLKKKTTWCSNWWLRLKPFHPNVLTVMTHIFRTGILPSICSSTCRLRRCVIRSPPSSSINWCYRKGWCITAVLYIPKLPGRCQGNSFLTSRQQIFLQKFHMWLICPLDWSGHTIYHFSPQISVPCLLFIRCRDIYFFLCVWCVC